MLIKNNLYFIFQCREGPVSLVFPLSSEPEYGEWTIRVEATNSYTEHSFLVENFVQSRFEVSFFNFILIFGVSPLMSLENCSSSF